MVDTAATKRPVVIWSIVLSLGFLGWIFSIVAVSSCNFISVGSFGLGIFSYYDDLYYGCTPYIGSADGAHRAAQAFGVISAFFSGVAFVLLFSMLFWKIPMILHRIIAGSYVFVSASQLLTLLFVKTTNDIGCAGTNVCLIGAAGVLAILAAICFIPCAVLMFVYPPPETKVVGSCKSQNQHHDAGAVGTKPTVPGTSRPPTVIVHPNVSVGYTSNEYLANIGAGTMPFGGGGKQETTYETMNDDNTKTITTVVEYSDGSKDITETVVPLSDPRWQQQNRPPPPPQQQKQQQYTPDRFDLDDSVMKETTANVQDVDRTHPHSKAKAARVETVATSATPVPIVEAMATTTKDSAKGGLPGK